METLRWKDYSLQYFRAEEDPALRREIQRFLVEGYEKFGYRGFSIDTDDRFSGHSFYWVVKKADGRIAATIRATHRMPESPVPIEFAERSEASGDGVFADSGNLMELNSFIYTAPRVLPILFRTLYEHTVSYGIQRVILLVDSQSARYQALYENSGFRLHSPSTYYFESFTREHNGEPVHWNLMKMDRSDIDRHWGDRRSRSRNETQLVGFIRRNDTSHSCRIMNLSAEGAKAQLNDGAQRLEQGERIALHLPIAGGHIEREALIIRENQSRAGEEKFQNLHLAFAQPLEASEFDQIQYREFYSRSTPLV